MQWSAPGYLWLALWLFPLWLALRRAARRRRLARAAFIGAPGEAAAAPPAGAAPRTARPGPGTLLRGGAVAAGGVLLIVSLCGPRAGELPEERVSRGADILIALDTSRSMLADDLRPTRLAAAKEAVANLAARLDGDRIGLIAFAGSAFLVCPLTSDYSLFRAALGEAGADSMPLGGTSLAGALQVAARSFPLGTGASKVLILISDGEDHAGNYQEELKQLRQAGVTVYGVAAGTAAGALIPQGEGRYLQDHSGATVKTRLQLAPLREIATAAGGTLELAAGPGALAELHRRDAGTWQRRERRGSVLRLKERFQLPLALALALLALEPLVPRRARP